ncbi:hypothetical protein MHYP_G00111350 [Metynnis hypsauchen]
MESSKDRLYVGMVMMCPISLSAVTLNISECPEAEGMRTASVLTYHPLSNNTTNTPTPHPSHLTGEAYLASGSSAT